MRADVPNKPNTRDAISRNLAMPILQLVRWFPHKMAEDIAQGDHFPGPEQTLIGLAPLAVSWRQQPILRLGCRRGRLLEPTLPKRRGGRSNAWIWRLHILRRKR